MLWRDRLFTMRELADGCRQRTSAWLSCAEAERFRAFRDPRSSLRWLAGRYAVKKLLGELLPVTDSWTDLHIESRDGRGKPSRPTAHLRGRLQSWPLALAHVDQYVYAAAALSPELRLGVDVVDLDSVAPAAIAFWFTQGEKDWCRRMACSTAFALVWSLKEASYKAGNRGEPFAPRGVDVCGLLPDAVILERLAGAWTHGSVAWTQDGRWISVCRRGPALAALVVAGTRRRREQSAFAGLTNDSRASDFSCPIGAITSGS
jgi:phosphopantetheinyl transferase